MHLFGDEPIQALQAMKTYIQCVGGGGASGSSTLESLMDKIAFRGLPKVVDLTSKRKLADQVLLKLLLHVLPCPCSQLLLQRCLS